MLPVKQANKVQVGVGQPQDNDIAWLEVGMADAETAKGRVPGDE